MTSGDRLLSDLIDREAIRDVVSTRYAHAIDWRDFDLLRSCFHPDATVDYGYFSGNAHEWCAIAVAPDPNRAHRFHYTLQPYIEIAGDTALSEGTGITGQRVIDGEGEALVLVGSRNFDVLTMRDGVWRISERRLALEFAQRLPHPTNGLAIPFLTALGPDHPDRRGGGRSHPFDERSTTEQGAS